MAAKIAVTSGELLRQARLRVGMSQEELAAAASVSTNAISALERGVNRAPSEQVLDQLAPILGLSTAERAVLVAARRRGPRHPRAGQGPPVSLPIGRERELRVLSTWLETPGLVSVIGPPGVGKTRLALTLAALARRDEIEVFIVRLETVRESEQVPSAVARALGLLAPGVDPTEALARFLGLRPALLLLDNAEQVHGTVGALTARLIDIDEGCAFLRVLVTSRTPLGVDGERCWPLAPLALPVEGLDYTPVALEEIATVALLVQRVRERRPSFTVAPSAVPALVTLCRYSAGLPLALELLAPRLAARSAPEAAQRLSLALFGPGGPDRSPRQRTLEAALDWSYDLLEEPWRRLFESLALFPGGCTLAAAKAMGVEAAQAMGAVVERGLEHLLNASLIEREEHDGHSRYRMLPPVREYALARLTGSGAQLEAARRQRAWCLALAEAGQHGLRGPQQAVWIARLSAEHANLSAALTGEASDDEDRLANLRLAALLWPYWQWRGHFDEGRRLLAHALAARPAATGETRVVVAQALFGAGLLAIDQGDYDEAERTLDETHGLARAVGNDPAIAQAMYGLGLVGRRRGETARARMLLSEARGHAGDDPRDCSMILNQLGILAAESGDTAQAIHLYTEACALRQAMGDARGEAAIRDNLGLLFRARGDYAKGTEAHRRAMALAEELNDQQLLANALSNLALLLMEQDGPDLPTAVTYLRRSLRIRETIGDQWGVYVALQNLGLAAELAQEERQRDQWQASALAAARRIKVPYAIANAQLNIGVARALSGDRRMGIRLAQEALDLFQRISAHRDLLATLENLALMLEKVGAVDLAVETVATVDQEHGKAGTKAPVSRQGELEAMLTRANDGLGMEHYEQTWQRGVEQGLAACVTAVLAYQPVATD